VGRPASLTRERIDAAATTVVERHGVDGLTARRVAAELGCDPSALYRHYTGMDELRRRVGDRLLGSVRTPSRTSSRTSSRTAPPANQHDGASWDTVVRRICVDLRRVLLTHRHLAALVQGAPTRLPNEVRITEALLAELLRAGLAPRKAADAYHALIELTIGSAAIDAEVAELGRVAAATTYRAWRDDYRRLDPGDLPALSVVAEHLYRGTAAQRFERALDAVIASIVPGRPD
jgi:AcrR family transcriptional regulator